LRVTATSSTEVFDHRVGIALSKRAKARDLPVRVQADAVVEHIVVFGPNDTNRFIRSYAQAGNIAGLRPRVLPPLRESKNRHFAEANLDQAIRLSQKNVERAAVHVKKWENLKGLYSRTASGKPGNRKHYRFYRERIVPELRKAKSALRFHTKRLDAAIRELEELGSEEGRFAVTFGGFGTGEVFVPKSGPVSVHVDKLVKSRAFKRRGGAVVLKRNIRVDSKIHGGTGSIVIAGDTTFVNLTSKEPHARLVQRKTRIVSRAVMAGKADVGAQRVSKKAYNLKLAEGTTWTRRAA